MNRPLGLLAALMEPPAEFEAEFNDWYDTEHIPERRAIEGFLTLQRFVCVAGAPRYLALYDLADDAVLSGPSYAAVSGVNTSPWSMRLAPRLMQRQRLDARQVLPGSAVLDGAGRAEALVLWHWRGVEPAAEPDLIAAVQASGRTDPGFAQARLFRTEPVEGVVDHLALVEYRRPIEPSTGTATPAIRADRLIRCNRYRRYQREAA